MIQRKMIAASISSSLLALLLGVIIPNPYREGFVVGQNYFISTTAIVNLFLMYFFPAVLLYGIATSIFSDLAGQFLSRVSENRLRAVLVSLILHVLFGLVLLPYSLAASILFFTIDKLLRKKNTIYPWRQAVVSLFIPIALWVISWVIVGIKDYMDMIYIIRL
ncbi:hypothetical protein [Peribacillus deserti]|uniref:Yip1 domain-containing protein n=1 Tax=Peribacillus deserti TaxID=673318 RepID=A0A2N5M5Z8_9BACI|nr:hypothetical protein [Peribacillus deserti]PLT29788.1 hypothetical protein CUU66_10815 [Peribacillus deserti]